MSDAAISLTILAIVVALFIWNRWPVELVAVGSAIALYATGVLTLPQALAGFGDPAVVLIAALFVVSEGLDATGVTTWVGQTVSQRAGSSPRRLVLAAMLLAAGLTALIGLNGTIAAMLPMMVAVALRTRFPTSRLLMPMAFAGSAGGMLLLTGSPVNVVISEAAEDAGVGAFGFAEFALAGIPLVVGTVLIVLLLGRWLLPDRASTALPPNLADQATTLIEQYGLDESVQLLGKDAGAAELVVPPRSPLVGRTVRPGQSIEGGRFIVLAVQRRGVSRGETRLEVGDAVLVEGTWAALEQLAADRDVLVVDGPEQVRRQTVPLGRRSGAAIGILVAMVVMLATGIVPPAVAALVAAGAMVLTRAVTMSQAYRGISWSTVLLVAGMIPMATAITVSGAGDSVAQLIVGLVGDAGPLALLVALFVITVVFGQLISNTATALIMIPVAVSAAEQMGVSPTTVLMSLCVAAAAAFMTPVATPANMMVMAPGGYRFGDYWKLGLPMVALYFAVSVGLVPLIWRF